MKEVAAFDVPNLGHSEPAEVVRHSCVGCASLSPPVETNFTLISARFGWRLHREKRSDGTLVHEWRCPTCWEEFRGRGR